MLGRLFTLALGVMLLVGFAERAHAQQTGSSQKVDTTQVNDSDGPGVGTNVIEPCPPDDPDCHDDDDGDGEPDDPPINVAPGMQSPRGSGWSRTITFDWSSVYGGDSYNLEISTSSDFSSGTQRYHTYQTTQRQVSGLAFAETYYWQVQAYNATYNGPWSEGQSFTTLPPPKPQLDSPNNKADDRPLSLTLDWDPADEAEQYRVQIKRRSQNWSQANTYVTGSSKTSQDISGLSRDTKYDWRVRSEKNGRTRGWRGRWFETIPHKPGTPPLASPQDDAVNQPVSLVLDWGAASGRVDNYHVEVRDAHSGSLVENATLDGSETSADVSGLGRGMTYNWRVRAHNAGGNSNWAKRSFTVVPHKPVAPRLIAPAREATDKSILSTHEWRTSSFHAVTVASQDYESSSGPWDKGYDNQSRTSAEALFGNNAWRVEATHDWTDNVGYAVTYSRGSGGLQQNATYAFSAWVKAPAGVDDVHLQMKYRVDGEWQYPYGNEGTDQYDRFGEWQRIEARLDLGRITDIERLSAIIRVKGTGQVAYIDNVRLIRLRPDPQQRPVVTEGYEYEGGEWQRSFSNQSRSNERAYEGQYSWRVESASGCDGGCAYGTHKFFNASELDLSATYAFSAWVWAPEDHDDINIQMKYKADGEWHYPGGAAKINYTGDGGWQYMEARLDLSQISDLERLLPVTRNVGTRAIACYWDEMKFRKVTGDDRYDVEVAFDPAFEELAVNTSNLAATKYVDTLRYETSYYWRVRARNSGGTGPWSASRKLTTKDAPPRRYYVKDHLGSVRAVVDAMGDVKEARDYYPFGLRMPGRSVTAGTPAREDFTGHERDAETGLHYAGARYYMSALGRWMAVDPLVDKNYADSPYAYVVNNPVNYVDLAGLDTTYVEEDADPNDNVLPELVVVGDTEEEGEAGTGQRSGAGLRVGGTPRFTHGMSEDGRTFYFDSSTRAGRRALYARLRSTPSDGCTMVGADRFSTKARSVAMKACIHSGQFAFLHASAKIGAVTLAMASVGTAGVGMLASEGVFTLSGALAQGATVFGTTQSLMEEKYGKAVAQGLTFGLVYGTHTGITSMYQANKLREGSTLILRSLVYTGSSALNIGVSQINK